MSSTEVGTTAAHHPQIMKVRTSQKDEGTFSNERAEPVRHGKDKVAYGGSRAKMLFLVSGFDVTVPLSLSIPEATSVLE